MIEISKFSIDNPRFKNILSRQKGISAEVVKTVSEIIEDIRNNGDKALFEYMRKFDGIDLEKTNIMVSDEEFQAAKKNISNEFKLALEKACDNIKKYHINQIPKGYKVNYNDGVVLERKYRPLKRVAVTVPGQMAPLISTLYMNLIPAIVAGVEEIYIITTPKNGKINDHILYVADYLGVRNIYKIAGAQGIAAVACGTESVKKVDAIVGPGNNYTQTAKKQLYGEIKIDSLAGPSEIAIIADEKANPTFVAADLLSQAEHGTGFEASSAFCLSYKKAEEIKNELKRLVEENELTIGLKSLANYGDIFVVDSIDEAIESVNMIAPEHVELLVEDTDYVVERVINAGAVFVGGYTPEPVGDYYCGSNHVLPTCGTARFSSGLSVLDFMRGYSIINYTKQALQKNGENVITLANQEGLKAHALAVKVRKSE